MVLHQRSTKKKKKNDAYLKSKRRETAREGLNSNPENRRIADSHKGKANMSITCGAGP